MKASPETLWLAKFVFLPGIAVFNVAFLSYQLWTGKANCWPWQTKSTKYSFWLLRLEQPLAYWLRIVGWTLLSGIWTTFALFAFFHR